MTMRVRRAKCRRGAQDAFLELDDIRVYLVYSEDDGAPVVQIETSPDTNSWQRLRVYMNDGEAVGWK